MKPRDVVTNPRLAGLVKRYHTWPVISAQSVGEHSWQVYRIYAELYGEVPASTAHFIMMHDAGELVSGDPPYPIKKNNKTLKHHFDKIEERAISEMGHRCPKLRATERDRVRLCHMLEMMEYGLHEMTLGNEYGRPIFERCRDASQDMVAEMGDTSLRKRALGYIRSAESRLA